MVNALTASVLTPPILERMRGWLAGVDVPDGLAVDTDLRWRLLQALIAHAAATEADIDAELERDPTDNGQRNAEQARALIPTPEAKQRAWQRAVHDDDLPRAITVAIVNGFNHPAQRPLLTPYVERYFAEIADLWARRTSEQAQPVVGGCSRPGRSTRPPSTPPTRGSPTSHIPAMTPSGNSCAGWCRKVGQTSSAP